MKRMPRKVSSQKKDPLANFAANMRHLRRDRYPGWGGQRRFAEFLGISPNDVSVYEYGRALPNEARLDEIAGKLGFTAGELLNPLPGVDFDSVPKRGGSAAKALAEEVGAGNEESARWEIAKLTAKVELLQEQLAAREERIRELEEANIVLRSAYYLEDTPDAAERRKQLLERLAPTIAGLMKEQDVI